MGIRSALPSGRVTQENDSSYLPGMMVIAPPGAIDESWQLLQLDHDLMLRYSPARLLEILADMSPEVAKALFDFQRLCNPGWEAKALRLTTTGKKSPNVRAQAAVDTFLALLDDHYGSVDVPFGRLFLTAFLRGALFSELVLDKSGRNPVDLVTPDPITVRFQRVQDPERGPIWQPGQWQNGKFVAFDRPTVRYTPIDPFPDSPYGRPLAAPAIFVSLFLLAMLHDIRRVVRQQGYPRLDISLDSEKMATILDQFLDDPETYQSEMQKIVDEVVAVFKKLKPDDTYVHSDVATVNRPVGAVDSSSLGAIDKLIMALERMATRALKSMPLMMGIKEGSSDTDSNRQWEIFVAGIKSIQHYCEKMLERQLGLALQAQGIQAVIEFRFAELRAAEMMRDAQVEQLRIQNAAAKRDQGWWTQDQASMEMTGEPAVGPAPSERAAQDDPQQDDGDGQERIDQGSDRQIDVIVGKVLERMALHLEEVNTNGNGYH